MKTLLFFTLFTLCTGLKAQQYPAEVSDRMTENKLKGLGRWTGILTEYRVTALGLDSADKVILVQRSKELASIKSLSMREDGTVQVTCAGGTHFDEVKRIFSSLVDGIRGVTQKYFIEAQTTTPADE